jgi:ArsR family transcriptional regulator
LVADADEICVCKIEQILNLPQPTVSRHLNRLKEAGWLEDRREGKWVYYRLADSKGSVWRRLLDLVLTQQKPRTPPGQASGRKRNSSTLPPAQLELEC